jgi:hypothetical protein
VQTREWWWRLLTITTVDHPAYLSQIHVGLAALSASTIRYSDQDIDSLSNSEKTSTWVS